MTHPADYAGVAENWRNEAGDDNPAGPLFAGGEYAASDIISATDLVTPLPACATTHCGTACSGSGQNECC